jgi:hypothetical protein
VASTPIRALATLLLSAVAVGCVIVPTPVTGSRSVGTAATLTRGPVGPLSLHVVFRRSSVVVRAVRARECERITYTIQETTRALQSKLVVPDPFDDHVAHNDVGGQLGAAMLMVVLAPATLTLSGIISETVVHLSRPTTTRTSTLDQEIEFECPVRVARLQLHASLPSGATVDGVTDDRGVCELAIPESEPFGLLSVWSADRTAARTVLYMDRSATPETPTAPIRIDVVLGAAPLDAAHEVRIDRRVVPLDRLRESAPVSVELRGPAQAIADYRDALADLLRGDHVVVDHWSVVGTGGSTVHAIFTVDP